MKLDKLEQIDDFARQKALDPYGSFIIQAPAGSGKTTLLTLRFLKLLSVVNDPEEILAVTFTKKAANEMRHRIIQALIDAKSQNHTSIYYKLAQNALQNSQAQGWELISNPNRLKIMTIDALCTALTSKMPILSEFGAVPEVTDDANLYYRQAFIEMLEIIETNSNYKSAFKVLLTRFDNQLEKIISLLSSLLSKRDQWLNFIYQDQSFEQSIQNIQANHIAKLKSCFAENQTELIKLIGFLIDNLNYKITKDNLNPESLQFWGIVANFLLTKQGEAKKRLTKKDGLPALGTIKDPEEKKITASYKEISKNILDHLLLDPNLVKLLNFTKLIPTNEDLYEQHKIIDALKIILPLLVANLKLVFTKAQKIDFIEMSLAALKSLSDLETDLLLKIDHQINHILIDEYQDTSNIQYQLFSYLTYEWANTDAKSLFLVGDPMQSIYQFRGAEVGIFLHTIKHGLNDFKLDYLQLTKNFRSSNQIVDWCNLNFKQIFPKESNIDNGQVNYSESFAANDNEDYTDTDSVSFIPSFSIDNSDVNNFNKIIEILKQHYAKQPNLKIAILARSKQHFTDLIPKLRLHELKFNAVELEKINSKFHCIDIIELIKALADYNDDLAWSCVLRSPLVGLSYKDLYLLRKNSHLVCDNYQLLTALKFDTLLISDDAKQRIKSFIEILNYWLQEKQRKSYYLWIKGLWLALGGVGNYYGSPKDKYAYYQDCEKLFAIIQDCSQNSYFDRALFEIKIAKSFVDYEYIPDQSINIEPLELLTLHKAKGLEYDIVIIPKLESVTQVDSKELLLWHKLELSDFLLACASQKSTQTNLYNYLKHINQTKTYYEMQRLFYVGVTRAKSKCYLFANFKVNKNNSILKPAKNSFASLLYPLYSQFVQDKLDLLLEQQNKMEQAFENNTKFISPKLYYRKPITWQPVDYVRNLLAHSSKSDEYDLNRPVMDSGTWRIMGIVLHKILQNYANNLNNFDLNKISTLLLIYRLGRSDLKNSIAILSQAINNIKADSANQWLFTKDNKTQFFEWELSKYIDNKIDNIIIDYAFIDHTDECLWIVDYKLSPQMTKQEIITCEHYPDYQKQLNKYKEHVSLKFKNRVKLGLYYPLAPIFIKQ